MKIRISPSKFRKNFAKMLLVMAASTSFVTPPLHAESADLEPYAAEIGESKFLDLVVNKYDLGSGGPQVVAVSDEIFVARRESDLVRVFVELKNTLVQTQVVQLPKVDDELAGAGKYILDLETRGNTDLFVSYLEFYDDRAECEHVVVLQFKVSNKRVIPSSARRVFTSTPCWSQLRKESLVGGYTASGRLAVDGERLFIEGGMVMIELGHNLYPNPGIAGLSGNFKRDVASTNLFGSVTEVNLKTLKYEKLSKGHRNPQGLSWDQYRKILWSSEHGPSGGCELNIIKKGKNYGWPAVSLGREYFAEDLLPANNSLKTKYGTHVGYELPAFAWNPSIGPSQLVVVPSKHPFGPVWTHDLLLSTLGDRSIYRITPDKGGKIIAMEQIVIGHRIRDLAIGASGLWASTDDGKLLSLKRFVSPAN